MYFRNYRLPRSWSLKYLKASVLEHLSRVNMFMGPKHC